MISYPVYISVAEYVNLGIPGIHMHPQLVHEQSLF